MTYRIKPFSFRQLLKNLLTHVLTQLEPDTKNDTSPAITTIAPAQAARPKQSSEQGEGERERQEQNSTLAQLEQMEAYQPAAEAIAVVSPRLAYIPRNISKIPQLNTANELLAQYFEQHRSTDETVSYLMMLADRFHCTIEMATFLAIMSIGGPQHLLYQDTEWDASTRHAVRRLHTALEKGCIDDVEFALKLYAAWAQEQQVEQLFIQPAALARTWHQRRVPTFSIEMRKALDTRTPQFLQEVLQATTFTQIRTLVEQYAIKESASDWLTETEKVFFSARQEAWATTFFINYSLLRSKVEPERERLLSMLDVHKKVTERRPINFDLLDKMRLLFAYGKAHRHDIPPYRIAIDTEWVRRFQQTPHSFITLARLLAEKTRTYSGDLLPTFTAQRLFLDQYLPLWSRYSCRVISISSDGKALVQLLKRIAEPPIIQEGFRTTTGEISSSSMELPKAESQPVEYTYYQRQNNTTGVLHASATSYAVGNLLEVEVTDYAFDDATHPHVLVALPPVQSPFEIFCQHYQVGDVPDVVVRSYEHYTDAASTPRVALIVQEPVSLLEITVEPEHISFLEPGEAIKEIALGTTLQLPVNDIDRERKVVTLSSLPLVELHLNKRLQELEQTNGIYELEATIRAVENDVLSLQLPWHDSAQGLVYVTQAALPASLAKPISYHIGDKVRVQLSFHEHSSSPLLLRLPREVSQALNLYTGIIRPFWEQHSLHFLGRMPYATYLHFLTLSSDRAYQQALRHLYRSTHQFELELIAEPLSSVAETPLSSISATLTESALEEDLVEELLQNNQNDITANFAQTPNATKASPLSRYKTGTRALGRVIYVRDFGAFVEIEPGVEGLIHKSKMWGYVADARAVLQPDQEVEVLVLGFNDEHNKLELSMQIPERNPLLNYKKGDIVHGKVTDVQEFGAFVDIAQGVGGLVHKSKMWGYVPDARDIVQVGDRVTVLVLEASPEKGGLTLSMEVPEHDPLQYYIQCHEAGQTVVGTISGIAYYGAFVDFGRSIKGLIPSQYIREGLTNARRSHLRVDDEVTVLIIRVDREKRRLELSLIDAK